MEDETETFTDYFLRYTADVPADEVARHQKFFSGCACEPEVTFDGATGWRTFTHHALES